MGPRLYAQDVAAATSPQEVEDRLTGKISKNLVLFLDERNFRVFTTARIQHFREKVVLEGTTENRSTGEDKVAANQGQLPGFRDMETAKPTKKNVNRNESQRFTFHERTKLTDVSVKLVLEQSLPQPAKDLAVTTAKEAVALTVGDVGKLEVKELDLAAPDSPATLREWVTHYLAERGASAIDLLYLSLLLLGSLGTLFALRHYFKGKKHAKEAMARASAGEGEQNKKDEECSQRLDELIDLLNKHPMITRNFLRGLTAEDKQVLWAAVRTPALRQLFAKILTIDPAAGADTAPGHDAGAAMEKILKDLTRYIRLSEDMEAMPFGYLTQLGGLQVAELIAREPRRVDALRTTAQYLADHQIREVTRSLSVAEKADFLDALHGRKEPSPEHGAYRTELDQRWRKAFEDFRKNAVVDAAENDALESAFLEGDNASIEVVRQLAKRYGSVPRTYEKYLVGFEQFLGLDLGIAKKVLQRVSNDVLTAALADRDLDQRLVSLLGDMRSQLITSMKKRQSNVSREDIEQAQNEVLRAYRAMV
jgi:hypothetical protein